MAVLVDDLGGSYQEVAGGDERPDPAGRSHVVVFPPADPAARQFRLDVPLVGVEERGDGMEVDIPVTPPVVSVGRYRMEVVASSRREAPARTSIRCACTTGGWPGAHHADRSVPARGS
jgi:hypothetical protein